MTMSRKIKSVVAIAGAAAAALALAGPAQATNPRDVLQEVPVPASGSCADYMSPSAINWAGVGAGSWSLTFGGKCVRTVMFDNSRQLWFVR